MLLGQCRHPFEDDNRLAIPARFRPSLADGAFITQGFDRNLLILTARTFQEVYQRVMALNITDPLARLLLRMILGTAAQLEMDEAGRVLVPPSLREFAHLDGEAVLVGQGDYLEVWSPSQWQKQETQLLDAETNTHRFAALSLAPG